MKSDTSAMDCNTVPLLVRSVDESLSSSPSQDGSTSSMKSLNYMHEVVVLSLQHRLSNFIRQAPFVSSCFVLRNTLRGSGTKLTSRLSYRRSGRKIPLGLQPSLPYRLTLVGFESPGSLYPTAREQSPRHIWLPCGIPLLDYGTIMRIDE